MGADSVHAEHGICEADLEQTRLKELMMGRARRTYVLAHGAKLGQSPFHAWAVMPARWTLVTDATAHPDQLARSGSTASRSSWRPPPRRHSRLTPSVFTGHETRVLRDLGGRPL